MTQSSVKKVMVIKVGGALLQSTIGMTELMQTAAILMRQGQPVVMVHGGGCIVEKQLEANGMVTQKLDGLRVTPPEQMPIIAGALAGSANKALQAAATKSGIISVGMSLGDADLVDATIKNPLLGLVGKVSPKNPAYLNFLLAQQWLPIVSSIAIDDAGQLLNVNADQAATALAQLIDGQLVLLSDVAGVLDDAGQLIQHLNRKRIETLIEAGVVAGGMKVKVEAALEVAEMMGQAVQIASWNDTEQLIALSNGIAVGTQIES